MHMATKLGKMVSYLDGLKPIKSHDSLITWFCKVRLQTNHYFSTTRVFDATRRDRMILITYPDKRLLVKSLDPLIMWSCEIRWKTKTIVSPLPECLLPPNLVGWWLTFSGSHPLLDPLVTWFCYITWQTETIICPLLQCLWPLTWQGGDLHWKAPIVTVTSPFNHVVLLDDVTN